MATALLSRAIFFDCFMIAILSYINTKSNGIAHALRKKVADAGNGRTAAHTG